MNFQEGENPMQKPKGLIHALLLNGKGGVSELSWQEASGWDPSKEVLWLHFDYQETETRQWIQEHSGLDDVSVEGLLCDESRPHVLTRGDNLLIVLRGVNLNPGSDPEDMVSLRVWTDGRRIISTRKRQLLSTEDLLASLHSGNGPKDASSLLTDWIDRIVQRMSDTVDSFEDELLDLEDRLFACDPQEERHGLLDLRRKCISIRRYLAPQREALNRLIGEPLSWLDEFNRLSLRGIADRQIRHIEDIDEVKERAAMVKEELSNSISEEMNKRTYVLTIVAAIFLPLGFFTGLMGINVGGMPGVENPAAFWVVVALCGGVTGMLAVLFYWKKWF